MKVTSIVKDAITDRVRTSLAEKYTNIRELEQKSKQFDSDLAIVIDEYEELAKKSFEDFIRGKGIPFEYTNTFEFPVHVNKYNMSQHNKYKQDLLEAMAEMDKEVEKKTNEIILALEFGGSKSDFNEIVKAALAH